MSDKQKASELFPEDRGARQRTMQDIGVELSRRAQAIMSVREWMIENKLIPEPAPTDPRKRALWLRDNRNTGPSKPHNWGKS